MEYQDFLNEFEKGDGNFKQQVYKRYARYMDDLALRPYQAELIKLQDHLEKNQQKMIILVEGRDAAGKGGSLRRITRYMNEKHYRVVALGKPSDVQVSQWYFQRYVEQFPRAGEMVLFDRSWYNRAMVEPIFEFCTKEQYSTFMNTVTEFEDGLVQHGIVFHKIYFSVSQKVQEQRFLDRETNELKKWKLSEIDVQMQEKWDEFTEMKYQMLKRTHTHSCPWAVIRSNEKNRAHVNAVKSILNRVDYENRNMSLDYTVDENIYYSGALEIELMENQLRDKGKFIV
jgi:polyphosphate kinase 2